MKIAYPLTRQRKARQQAAGHHPIPLIDNLDTAPMHQTEGVSEDDIVELPITSVFDLHTVPPRDVTEVVEAYLEAAWEKGLIELRIVHGKGIGVQREAVRKVLERTPFVESFRTAPEDAGGWGATLVTLRPVKLEER